MAKDKRRNKKYRPKMVRPAPILYDAMHDAMTDDDIAALYERGALALDLCQLGSEEIGAYADVRSAIRECFILSAAYENKAQTQALCLLADAGVLMVWASVNGETVKEGNAFVNESAKARRVALEPAQRVLEILAEMHRSSPRSELISAYRAGLGHQITVDIKDAGVIQDNGVKPPKGFAPLGERGLAWVHGECRPGFLDWDGHRLVWRMPLTDSQVHLSEPTLILIASSGKKYCEEAVWKAPN